MAKLKDYNNDGHPHYIAFYCPACKYDHAYRIARHPGEPETAPVWTFNGDYEKPTFRASLLIYPHGSGEKRRPRCHLFVTDGKIEYCSDCEHELAGQTVDLPEYED